MPSEVSESEKLISLSMPKITTVEGFVRFSEQETKEKDFTVDGGSLRLSQTGTLTKH
jgi:hypothetical protein